MKEGKMGRWVSPEELVAGCGREKANSDCRRREEEEKEKLNL